MNKWQNMKKIGYIVYEISRVFLGQTSNYIQGQVTLFKTLIFASESRMNCLKNHYESYKTLNIDIEK